MITRIKLFIALSLIGFYTHAQKLSREEAVQAALKNNEKIKATSLQIDQARQAKRAAADFGNFSAMIMKGQYNTIEQDNNLTLTQGIPFPSTLAAQVKLGQEHVAGAQVNLVASQNNLAFEVKTAYETLLYYTALQQLLLSQDSLFTDFARAATARYKAGETTLLEKVTAESQQLEARNQLQKNEADIYMVQSRLQLLLNSTEPLVPTDAFLKRTLADGTIANNPLVQVELQQAKINRQVLRVERNRFLPTLELGYFNQTLIGYQNTNGSDIFYNKNSRFQGFMVGASFPLWFGPQAARAKAAAIGFEASQKNAQYAQSVILQEYEQTQRELLKNEVSLSFYETSALKNATLIISQAGKSFRAGEINYVEYLQALRTALSIKTNYLAALQQYNLTLTKLEHLTGSF
ncbi:MAG: TolC family protein [Cyclobacteriaceae bacterium]|nr:TolC family protein [Cyclobacteriaceae bacterium]